MNKDKRFLQKINKVMFFIYDFIGLRYIQEMIITPVDEKTGKRKPITFFLWLVGIYMAIFSIASSRYENRVNLIEDRMSAINVGLSAPINKLALGRISQVQNIPCPVKPDILRPHTAIISLFRNEVYYDGVDILKTYVENWSDNLQLVDLSRADLRGTNLSGANLGEAVLRGANLSRAILIEANLFGANLGEAVLNRADLTGADLTGSIIELYQLKEAHLDTNTTMVDGTKYNESWRKLIAEAEGPTE